VFLVPIRRNFETDDRVTGSGGTHGLTHDRAVGCACKAEKTRDTRVLVCRRIAVHPMFSSVSLPLSFVLLTHPKTLPLSSSLWKATPPTTAALPLPLALRSYTLSYRSTLSHSSLSVAPTLAASPSVNDTVSAVINLQVHGANYS